MDRSWMLKDRRSKDYDDGVEQFLNFATIHAKDLESIRCPCIQCGNLIRQPIPEIRNHLFVNGIDRSYRTWIWHGEPVTGRASQSVNTRDFSYQEVNSPPLNDVQEAVEMVEAAYNDCMVDSRKFKKLIEDAEKPLFPGCTKFTKLSALVRIYKYKANNDLTNKGFAELLEMVGDLLPDSNEMPLCIYEAGKTMTALGMEYEKIHACLLFLSLLCACMCKLALPLFEFTGLAPLSSFELWLLVMAIVHVCCFCMDSVLLLLRLWH